MSLRFDFAPFLARKGARRMVERVFQHLASGVGHLLTCVGVHARPNTQGGLHLYNADLAVDLNFGAEWPGKLLELL